MPFKAIALSPVTIKISSVLCKVMSRYQERYGSITAEYTDPALPAQDHIRAARLATLAERRKAQLTHRGNFISKPVDTTLEAELTYLFLQLEQHTTADERYWNLVNTRSRMETKYKLPPNAETSLLAQEFFERQRDAFIEMREERFI